MLAIQSIKMYWTKENRTPKGSVARRQYYSPGRIESSVILDLDKTQKNSQIECFIHNKIYIQESRGNILSITDYNKFQYNAEIHMLDTTKYMKDERRHRFLLEQAIYEKDNQGKFVTNLESVNIPGINIIKENDNYRIIWYSLENGYQPVRTGYNSEYNSNTGKNAGRKIKCETAFVLEKGEAGRVEYNYRYTSYFGQHYEQYCIYFINIDKIEHNSFVKAKYEKEYNELVNLF